MSSRMLALALTFIASPAFADDWPQWLGPQRDGIWRETNLIDHFPKDGPKVLWRTPIGEGYSGPAVANGKVFITDRILSKGAAAPKNPFDAKSRVEGTERVLCLDEKTGAILWKHEYDCPYQVSYAAGPRTTPIVSGDKVYTLGAMGDLLCLDVNKGTVLWSKNLLSDYVKSIPIWGFAGSPLIDGNRLICLVGGKGSVAVAFDKDSGKELWKSVSAGEPGYAPPVIYTVGGKKLLFIWNPESLNALDPESGKVHWSHHYARGKNKQLKAGLSVSMPRLDGDKLFLTAFYEGAVLLKLNGTEPPTEIWRSGGRSEQPDETDGLHSIMPTPIVKDGHIYGICSYGELRCLDEKTGKRVWSTHAATGGKSVRWANAFLVEQGDRFILFNEHGDLIIAKLTPKGYEEISRANILTPTNTMAGPAGRRVIWSHPAFADRSCFARNDREIIRVSLAKD